MKTSFRLRNRSARAKRQALLEALEDRTLFSTFTVTNTLDNGSVGSLRWAVEQANSNPGPDAINFDASVFATPQTITLGGTPLELTDTTGATTISGPTGGVTISGGGLSGVLQIDALVTASVSGVTITGGNVAGYGYGGGLLNYGNVALTNCTISGNSASYGGGIANGTYANQSASATLINCTVSGNSGFGDIFTHFGSAQITNTIVGYLTGSASGSNNLLGSSASGGLTNGTDGNIVGVSNLGLAPLGVYGGTSETLPLLPGSPAIGAGITGPGIPTTDERGLSQSGAEDIGAFQSQGFQYAIVPGSTPQSAAIGTTFAEPLAFTVTANNPVEPVNGAVINFVAKPAANGASAIFVDGSSGVITNGEVSVTVAPNNILGKYTVSPVISGFSSSFALTNTGTPFSPLSVNTTSDALIPGKGLLSLREAIAFANAESLPNANISFDKTVFKTPQTITLTNGQLELSDTKGTTITGPANGVTISGGSVSRVFQIDSLVTASISGLTITDGNSGYGYGGGLINRGTLSLSHCTISDNTGGFYGGGVANLGAATLSNCTVSGNSAGVGGGLSSNYTSTVALSNCTVSGNSASNFILGGGGLFLRGTASLTNCTVSNNSAGEGSGGGLLDFIGSVTLAGTTISGNSASIGNGGGISNEGGTTILTRCSVSGNTANSGGGVATDGFVAVAFDSSGVVGVYIDEGKTTLTNCSVTGNTAIGSSNPRLASRTGLGGGVLTLAIGETTLTNCSVTGNSANNGGGVFTQGLAPSPNYGYTNYASATLTNCTVSGNTAALNGGGVDNSTFGTTTITGSGITCDTASAGGGIFNDGSLIVNSSLIDNNSATTAGGGISTTGGSAAINKSVISFNQVNGVNGTSSTAGGNAVGGGIDCENSALTLSNSSVVLNQADGGDGETGGDADGGGIYLSGDSTASLTNDLLSGNLADGGDGLDGNGGDADGGGIYIGSGASAILGDSIISLNLASGGRSRHGGSAGQGIGGGVFNAGAFTFDSHSLIALNFASTSGNNVAT